MAVLKQIELIVIFKYKRSLMAEIVLNRQIYTSQTTIGVLTYGDKKTCFTLEDVCRDKNKDGDLDDAGETKIKHETAIPSGRYKVIVTYSNRFKKPLPLLLDVKGFEGIRIHPGNTKADTSGCILPGITKGENVVYRSRDAFNDLFNWIKSVINKEDIYIKIVDKK